MNENESNALSALYIAAGSSLHDLLAMIDASDRGEVWTVNAGTRLRVDNLRAAMRDAEPLMRNNGA